MQWYPVVLISYSRVVFNKTPLNIFAKIRECKSQKKGRKYRFNSIFIAKQTLGILQELSNLLTAYIKHSFI